MLIACVVTSQMMILQLEEKVRSLTVQLETERRERQHSEMLARGSRDSVCSVFSSNSFSISNSRRFVVIWKRSAV